MKEPIRVSGFKLEAINGEKFHSATISCGGKSLLLSIVPEIYKFPILVREEIRLAICEIRNYEHNSAS